jgi:hypothetical protein
MVKRRGDQAGVEVWPHRFRHHFSHTWLDRGGAEGDLMELNGWSSPQMLQRYGGSARGARAPPLRPHHEGLTQPHGGRCDYRVMPLRFSPASPFRSQALGTAGADNYLMRVVRLGEKGKNSAAA